MNHFNSCERNVLPIINLTTLFLLLTVIHVTGFKSYAIKTRFSFDISNTSLKVEKGNENENCNLMNDSAQKPISGLVTNLHGVPLAGVTVRIKGSATGTITDSNGNYSISNVTQRTILQFSFSGMMVQEVVVRNNTEINVKLTEDINSGEIVEVGYGTQKKINLTGAVDQIEEKYLRNLPVPNISRALIGVIPNLNIRFSDGRPNSIPVYNVRGLTSIAKKVDNEALILIDGVEGDPLNLSPQDIESITVLKDAGSAAVYGSRGTYGVVLITTKNPGKSKTKLTYSSSYSLNNRTVNPHVVSDSYTFSKMYNEAIGAWYDYNNMNLAYSKNYLEKLKYRAEHPGELPDVEVNSSGRYEYYGNTDWNKLLNAEYIPSMEHSLAASGGGDKFNYNMSGRFFNQDGLYKTGSENFNKYNLRFKFGFQITAWFRVTDNIDYSSYNYTDPFSGETAMSVLNTHGLPVPMDVLYNPDNSMTYAGFFTNGVLSGKTRSITSQSQLRNNFGFTLSVIKEVLKIKGDFAYQNLISKGDTLNIPGSYSAGPGIFYEYSDRKENGDQNQKNYTYDLYMDFVNKLGNHNLKFLFGENIEKGNFKYHNFRTNNLLIKDYSDIKNFFDENYYSYNSFDYEWFTSGTFSRLNYDYKQKYLFEVSGRYDGSSKHHSFKAHGFFPSVSMGWRISDEKFMKSCRNWLADLKIRTSYGSSNNSQFTGETSSSLNFGVDGNLFRNKLNFSFDRYKRTTSGGSAQIRTAKMDTKGFEFSLNWTDKINTEKPINYSIRLSLADNVSYIGKNAEFYYHSVTYPSITYSGMRVGDIWGYVTEGLFSSTEDIKNHANQNSIYVSSTNTHFAGDIKFKDLNKDGKIDKGKRSLTNHGDWKIIGNSTPRYSYGISLNAEWNNFSFSAFFQGIGKRDWYPPYQFREFWGQYNYGNGMLPKHTLVNAYTLDNPDPNAYWPRYKANIISDESSLQPQTRYLQNASYIRLKDLTIAYSMPKSIVNRVKLSNIQIFFTGQNLWTYTPIFKITKDIDPETIDGSGNVYPMFKTYSLGLNLSI